MPKPRPSTGIAIPPRSWPGRRSRCRTRPSWLCVNVPPGADQGIGATASGGAPASTGFRPARGGSPGGIRAARSPSLHRWRPARRGPMPAACVGSLTRARDASHNPGHNRCNLFRVSKWAARSAAIRLHHGIGLPPVEHHRMDGWKIAWHEFVASEPLPGGKVGSCAHRSVGAERATDASGLVRRSFMSIRSRSRLRARLQDGPDTRRLQEGIHARDARLQGALRSRRCRGVPSAQGTWSMRRTG